MRTRRALHHRVFGAADDGISLYTTDAGTAGSGRFPGRLRRPPQTAQRHRVLSQRDSVD